MCTALTYLDAASRPYVGRTLELELTMPYQLVAVPAGTPFRSQVPGKQPVEWTSTHTFIAFGAPEGNVGADGTPPPLMVLDGANDVGLTVNVNAYPGGADNAPVSDAPAVLEAADLTAWLLGRFSTVSEARAALATQPVNPTRMETAGNAPWPLHVMVTDAGGESAVIEYKDGELQVLDNPVRVMTNRPDFQWHLTNLDNWTHLDHTDKSSATFGRLHVNQPDSGIAMSALPASNTSVGRFVRAVYYTTFVEKVGDPETALTTLSRIINNFDRPRGATIDPPSGGAEGVAFGGADAPTGVTTEYTTHTFLSDTTRGRYLIRAYTSRNWSEFHLDRLTGLKAPVLVPVTALDNDAAAGDATELLLGSAN
jgi:choloylglycine hydrolase